MLSIWTSLKFCRLGKSKYAEMGLSALAYLVGLKFVVNNIHLEPNANTWGFYERQRSRSDCTECSVRLLFKLITSTLSQTTNFRLFQIQRVCRQQF